MRKLTYTVTGKNGSVNAGITSFSEAVALTRETGGKMDAVMVDIAPAYNYTGKRVRPVAKAPIE